VHIEFCVPVLLPHTASCAAESRAARVILERSLHDLRERDRHTDLKVNGSSAVFHLPAAFHANSDLVENAAVLDRLMLCLTELDTDYRLRRPGLPWLYSHPLRYARTIVWDTTPALYARGGGDCKSLSACRAAEFWAAGIPAKIFFRFLPPELTSKHQFQYHLLLLPGSTGRSGLAAGESVGGFECPSKIKGMAANENSYFSTYFIDLPPDQQPFREQPHRMATAYAGWPWGHRRAA
jgi:hypothetical protein